MGTKIVRVSLGTTSRILLTALGGIPLLSVSIASRIQESQEVVCAEPSNEKPKNRPQFLKHNLRKKKLMSKKSLRHRVHISIKRGR